ncbi:disintegrin and metalloproteinase domain-containing protein 9 isoform X1 [Gambusia affinis]|uniref:disintegrin and metalloproteinase domain-containing protein 9 isoform X1 n=1 Tax=Gambusia affinis TaxID=33528 RepID=UPI001CDC8122|nr:disintegrin and metalloproteinase domain-containing protein 9 isoform X1 [Gambusia affinis]
MMVIRKPILFAFILHFCISGTENKEDFSGFTSKLPRYSIVKPQVINNRWTRSLNGTSQTKEAYGDKVSYTLMINNKEHILHLEKNREFLHPNFVQYSRDASGNYNISYPRQHVNCYYHGSVEGYDRSVVALSTCSGLRGVILLDNETFGLEPVPASTTNEHALYLLKDSHSEPVTCGVISEATSTPNYEPFEPAQSMTSLLRKKRALPQTSFIELVLVVDNLRYNYKKKNETAIREEMVQMANLLDGYYKPLNIRVVLVGLEIFNENNPFSVDGTAGEVLGEFVKWRKSILLPKIRHDIGQLIVGRPDSYSGGVLGMAFVGTVCSVASSGGINVYSLDNLNYVSTVVAHEMGHNLGMNHDSSDCTCDGKSCIMSASASGSGQFSKCSEQDFEALILRGGGVCLRNQPSASNVIGTAECGNGRLDKGEECDCGTKEECKNECCDAATCKLTRGSYCAHGACCDKCQLKVAGTQCRKSADVCDLPEYCDGKTGFCPPDFYLMDGLPCKNDAAYCYEGRCQTYDYQCLNLFGSGAQKANDICFQYENVKGNVFGNCGITSNGNYIKCTVANAKCGKVQCTNVDLNNHPVGAQISIEIVQGSRCVNADFNLGTDVLDPAYVKPGSPCDKGKTCMDFKCVNASVLVPNLGCDAQTTCSGRGVCNNQGHCHCDDGWAPPNCNTAGRGGSIDSGPAMIDYSLRNGLLIFFLLVVPLLVAAILLLLYMFKRESLDICLKRRKRPRSTGNRNANPPTNGNVQTDVTIQPPRQVPPERPPAPSVTSAPIPGFRYGELDYWTKEANEAPARPPAPVQGPGVPRPIPVKDIAS